MFDKGIICLSFDDGRADNFRLATGILAELKMPATYNISTAYVDGSIPPDRLPSSITALSIEEVREIHKSGGNEIAGHGDQHLNDDVDIQTGREKLIKWLEIDPDKKIGFASPFVGIDSNFVRKNPQHYQTLGFEYVRVSLRIKTLRWFRILCRKTARIIKSGLLFRLAYSETLMRKPDGILLYSIPILRGTSLGQVKAIINECVKQKKVCILMFHSILNSSEILEKNNWTWDYDRFADLCNWIKKLEKDGLISVETTHSAFSNLMKERLNG